MDDFATAAVDRLDGRRAAATRLARPLDRDLARIIQTRVNSFLSTPADGAGFDAGPERIRIDIDLCDNAP
jgi:hypothetical protein